jgi:UDP-glucose:(heptosyl)LPS alpha-1,3-glucosyltransferase
MVACVAGTKPVKIAFIVDRWGQQGGTEGYVWNLVRWLISQGHQVTVFAGTAEEGGRKPLPGAQVHSLGIRPVGVYGLGVFLWKTRRLPLESFDVVQGFGRSRNHQIYRSGGGVHAVWLRRKSQGWKYYARRAFSIKDYIELSVDREAQTSAQVLVCNSRMSMKQATEWLGVDASRIQVVRNGVDLKRFRPRPELRADQRALWSVPETGRVVMFLGGGFARKGLGVALKAFGACALPEDRFVVVGKDRRLSVYQDLANRCAWGQVRFLDPTNEPELMLAAADVSILPTLYDSAANTTLEAMACGVTPVTSIWDGNAEIHPDPQCVIDDPRAVTQVSDALTYALNNMHLGEACRAAAECWPVSRNGKAMESIYQRVVYG